VISPPFPRGGKGDRDCPGTNVIATVAVELATLRAKQNGRALHVQRSPEATWIRFRLSDGRLQGVPPTQISSAIGSRSSSRYMGRPVLFTSVVAGSMPSA